MTTTCVKIWGKNTDGFFVTYQNSTLNKRTRGIQRSMRPLPKGTSVSIQFSPGGHGATLTLTAMDGLKTTGFNDRGIIELGTVGSKASFSLADSEFDVELALGR